MEGELGCIKVREPIWIPEREGQNFLLKEVCREGHTLGGLLYRDHSPNHGLSVSQVAPKIPSPAGCVVIEEGTGHKNI